MSAGGAPGQEFSITSPAHGSSVRAFEPFTISARHDHPELVERVTYYLNGGYIGGATQPPYSITLVPEGVGQMQLTAIAETTMGSLSSTIVFTIQ